MWVRQTVALSVLLLMLERLRRVVVVRLRALSDIDWPAAITQLVLIMPALAYWLPAYLTDG